MKVDGGTVDNNMDNNNLNLDSIVFYLFVVLILFYCPFLLHRVSTHNADHQPFTCRPVSDAWHRIWNDADGDRPHRWCPMHRE